jgi:hypothetical protein
MKPLNRPMFRYGGPIKEGVMSGIREPKKDGGMLLVGQHPDRFKDAGGREKHLAPIVYGAGLGLARLAPLAMRAGPAAMRYGRKGLQAVKNIFGSTKPFQGPVGSFVPGKLVASRASGVRIPSSGSYSGVKFTRTPGKTSPAGPAMGEAFVPNPFGSYLGGTISGKALMGLYKGATSPTAVGLTQKAGKAIWATAKDPLTIAAAAYYFYPDGTPKPDKELEMQGPPPPGGLGKLLEDTDNKAAAGSGVELSPKEKRAQQIEKYRDIMDIKGMNKAAAYDSLIAASQAVNQAGGDLKGAIRDGSLINQIIQSTSKAFDKPAKTKDAIDTLILKGEIEKDIKASDPSTILDAEYKRAKIAESKEKLNPSFNTLKAGYGKDNKGQSGIDLAAAEYSDNQGQTFRGNIISKSDFNEIKEDIKEKSGTVDEITIITNWTNATIKGKNVSDGNYTVGDKIVTIKDNVVIAVE